jgi:hypothetical protein
MGTQLGGVGLLPPESSCWRRSAGPSSYICAETWDAAEPPGPRLSRREGALEEIDVGQGFDGCSIVPEDPRIGANLGHRIDRKISELLSELIDR